MTIDKRLLFGGVAAIALLGIATGFVAARMSDPHGAVVAEEHAEKHEEGEHEPGFVALKPVEAAESGVELAKVERGGGSDLILAGRVAVMNNAQSTIGAPLAGTVIELQVAPGASVKRGGAIATIRSPEGALARANLDASQAAAEAANAADARDKSLLDQGVIARQEWEATHASALKAQADLRAAQAQAATMGNPGPNGTAVVRSTINGVVTRTLVSPGSVVESGAEIATVSDSSRVELVLDAPPATTGLISVGSHIEARWTGGPVFEAEVTGVAPGAAGSAGTVRARVIGAPPPPGTVVSGRLVGGPGDVLTVPSESIQKVDGKPSVFVVEEEGFRAHPVVTGRTASGRTEIVSGLEGDEQIAGVGAFLLKAELGKSEVEDED